MISLNETHDPARTSWLASANVRDTEFPIQNLPFAVFRRRESTEEYRGGAAIGDQIVDLKALWRANLFDDEIQRTLQACAQSKLNAFFALGHSAWSALRLQLSRALREGFKHQAAIEDCLVPQSEAEFDVPVVIGDYTDFYTSIHHATNIGKMFRPDNPLLPNYRWIPIGYHGRSSSIDVSGQVFKRPNGQLKGPDQTEPVLAPCRRLDYELEVGIFVGSGNTLGKSIPIDIADDHVFGLCLFNDWSARDIQAWEYQPLGPFLSKSFASTISPLDSHSRCFSSFSE